MVTNPIFTLRSGETWRNPFSMYRNLRDHDPVHYVPDGDFWFLSRFADVFAAARDSETFSSSSGLTVDSSTAFAHMDRVQPIVFLDPPDHTVFRRLVARSFMNPADSIAAAAAQSWVMSSAPGVQ